MWLSAWAALLLITSVMSCRSRDSGAPAPVASARATTSAAAASKPSAAPSAPPAVAARPTETPEILYRPPPGAPCITSLALDEHSLYMRNARGSVLRMARRKGAKPVTLFAGHGWSSRLGLSLRNVYFDDEERLARLPKHGGTAHHFSHADYWAPGAVIDARGAVWIEEPPNPGRGYRVVAIDDAERKPRVLWRLDATDGSCVWTGSLRLVGDGVTWVADVARPTARNAAPRWETKIFKVPRAGGDVTTPYTMPTEVLEGRRCEQPHYLATSHGAVVVVGEHFGPSKLLAISASAAPTTLATGKRMGSLQLHAIEGETVLWTSLDDLSLHRSSFNGAELASPEFLGWPVVLPARSGVPDVPGNIVFPQSQSHVVRDSRDIYLLNVIRHPHSSCTSSWIDRLPGTAPQ